MRPILLVLGLLGFLLFGAASVLSFFDPLLVERTAREIVRIEVEQRVGERIDSLSGLRVVGLAQRMLQKTEADIAHVRQALRDEIPRKVANAIADMLRADCECRKRLAEYAQKTESEHLSSLTQIREKLSGLIESVYASVTTQLLREFRIVTASNAIAFALLGLITLMRRKAAWQLALPAIVLVMAVIVTGGLYLFNQSWLHTVVFQQYVGLGYAAYLSGVALLLADVVFNRARVTTQLVNAGFHVVGSAAKAVPC